MHKLNKTLLICGSLFLTSCQPLDSSMYNKNQENKYILEDKDLEYYPNLTFKEVYEIKERYYLDNKESIDKNSNNIDIFTDINIYGYYGTYNIDSTKITIISLLYKDQGVPGVIQEVTLGEYTFKFSGLIPDVYYFKDSKFYSLSDAYSLNYLSNEILESLNKWTY